MFTPFESAAAGTIGTVVLITMRKAIPVAVKSGKRKTPTKHRRSFKGIQRRMQSSALDTKKPMVYVRVVDHFHSRPFSRIIHISHELNSDCGIQDQLLLNTYGPTSSIVSGATTHHIRAIKSVKFKYKAGSSIHELLETFRAMVNDAIRICLDENIQGRLKLRDRIYKQYQNKYGVVSCYPYSVAEVAWSIVRKHKRWNRRPCANRLMIKMDVQNYSLNHTILSLPYKRRERILLQLEYGEYQRSFLVDESLKRGSVTITEQDAIIVFSKETSLLQPTSRLGIDLNEKSAVCSDGSRYDLSEVARLHTEYGVRRAGFYEKHPQDQRLKKKFAGSRREKERVRQILHRTAKEFVETAKKKKQVIVFERLKGVRYAHAQGNGEPRNKRRRIAQWPFRLLQAFVTYKANWEGVPIEFVSASYTSQICHNCDYINRKLKLVEREWRCPKCGAILDRDFNAAINIERRGRIPCLGEVRPGAQDKDETVKGNPTTPVILRVEALNHAGTEVKVLGH
jgi:putative transposase